MKNKMTTEQFLADLVANTVKLNKARLDYAQKLSELRDNYDEELDSIQARERQALDELHDAREEFESSEEIHPDTFPQRGLLCRFYCSFGI